MTKTNKILLQLQVSESASEEEIKRTAHYTYPNMTKRLGNFKLTVSEGSFSDSEILVLLGENGTGKTTFIRMLAGNIAPDETSGEFASYFLSNNYFNL